MITLYLLCAILIILIVQIIWSRRKFYLLSWKLDGPVWYPILGNAWHFRDSKAIMKNISQLRNLYTKPLRFWLGSKLFIYIDTPKELQQILHAPECLDKSVVYKFIKNFLGDGLFISEHKRWSHHRKLINPSFSHKVLMSFFPIFNEQTDILCTKFNDFIGKGDICLTDTIMRYNLDISCQTTMGVQLNIQNNENTDILNAYKATKLISGLRIFSPWLQPELLFKLTSWYQMQKRSQKDLYDFINKLIETKLSAIRTETNSTQTTKPDKHSNENISKEENIFIDQAIRLVCDKNQFSWNDVHAESNVLVAAAFDTTALTVSYIILCLAMYPNYQEKVIEEIALLFPNDDFQVTFEDTKNMVYCNMVINETLRLFPSLPIVARTVIEDFKLNDDITIPKGTEIVMDLFSLHRDEQYWGPDANKFNPERFIDQLKDMHPYAYLPFSKGPRNCIGWRYAIFALKIFMAKIFKKYRFTSKLKLEDLTFRMEITLKSLQDPIVQVHKI